MRPNPYRIYKVPRLSSPQLIIGWHPDAGKLGTKVIDYLNKKLGAEKFCEFEPLGFFPQTRVAIEDDIIQFPTSEFFVAQQFNLIAFKSWQPQARYYEFLNLILDVAEKSLVRRIYTLGGLSSKISHNEKRRIFPVVNKRELKGEIEISDFWEMDYQGPPAISSFLLWIARKRNIEGVSLWQDIPFYLVAWEDPKAVKNLLEFFDRKFELRLDFKEIDQEIEDQTEKINQMRSQSWEIDNLIKKLEQDKEISEDEALRLVKEIDQYLSKKD